MKVAILGGGISGAAAARFLMEKGVEVDVLERDETAGGLMRSDVVDGYTFDRSGGHILFSKDEWYKAFVADLFAEDELVASERNTKILYDGRWVHYPFENGIGDLDVEDRLQCVKGYVEAWAAREAGAAAPDNFGDWIVHRFGDGICDRFMRPYNEKIWKSDLREMGTDWVEGRVPIAPLEDILRAAMGVRTEGYTHQMIFHYPRTGGFQEVFERIAAPVRPHLRTGVTVRHIERKGERLDVDGTLYDLVISTIPLPILADVLTGLDSTAKEAAKALRHRSVTSFLLGIDGDHVRPFSWIYLPHAKQGPANRITYLSNYSPENAPAGRGSLQAEVTHDGPLVVDDSFLDAMKGALGTQDLLDPKDVTPLHWHANEWAYILYDRDFTEKRRLAIEGAEAMGVIPLGRFGRFDYHNSDQCVVAAKRTVERILERANAGG
ncbi:MAG: protoporphyrinogen/coproporphyrinogen oxidase [Planctomycetota bacterium JB042]